MKTKQQIEDIPLGIDDDDQIDMLGGLEPYTNPHHVDFNLENTICVGERLPHLLHDLELKWVKAIKAITKDTRPSELSNDQRNFLRIIKTYIEELDNYTLIK